MWAVGLVEGGGSKEQHVSSANCFKSLERETERETFNERKKQ